MNYRCLELVLFKDRNVDRSSSCWLISIGSGSHSIRSNFGCTCRCCIIPPWWIAMSGCSYRGAVLRVKSGPNSRCGGSGLVNCFSAGIFKISLRCGGRGFPTNIRWWWSIGCVRRNWIFISTTSVRITHDVVSLSSPKKKIRSW